MGMSSFSMTGSSKNTFDEQWLRRLELLKLAFEKPVFTSEDLVNPSSGRVSIYDETVNVNDRFKSDRYWLRDTLDVHIEPVGGPGTRGTYTLKRIGPRFAHVFLPAGLVTLTALAQLPQVAPHFPPALLRDLLTDIEARLGTDGAHVLDEALVGASQLAVWRDQNTINADVLAVLRQAVRERLLVTFAYQPARGDDDERRQHTVEPYETYVHDGHMYLRCYAVRTLGPYGETPGNHYDLRIGRIVPDTMVLSDQRFTVERPRPRVFVHYLLSRKLAKDCGSVNFDEIERRIQLDGRI